VTVSGALQCEVGGKAVHTVDCVEAGTEGLGTNTGHTLGALRGAIRQWMGIGTGHLECLKALSVEVSHCRLVQQGYGRLV
jgi:hypothetical protein